MNEALSKLADVFFKNTLNSSPTSAIMRGYREYFDQIEELTEARFDQNLKDLDKFEKRLNEIDFNNLSNKEKVTHGMLEYAFGSNKDSLLDKSWEFGAGVSGFTGYLIDYNQQMFIPELESADLLLKRLELYNQFFNQVSLVQKKGLDGNRVATERNILRTIDQIESYLKTSLEEDPLLLVNFSPEVSEEDVINWKEKAKLIIDGYVRPSVNTYLEQLKSEHLPKGRSDMNPGIMWIEGGDDIYLRSLRKFTGNKDITVQQVHETGLSEIKRLKKEFLEIGKKVFKDVTTPEEVIYKMQTEPSMRFESKEQMLQMAEDTIKRAYEPLADWFTVFPKAPCNVLPVPEESEKHAPPAYYYSPLPDGSRDGTYFLNTYKPETKSIF